MRLKDRQQRTFRFVRSYIDRHGWPPTVSDIADGMDVSRGAAHTDLEVLEAAGYLKRGRGPRQLAIEEGATL